MDQHPRENRPLEEQVAHFVSENPQIVEAMRLFGMSMNEYRGALHGIDFPQVVVSNSTAPTSRQELHKRVNG